MNAALAPLRAWWRALAARERRLVAFAAAALALFLLWTLALQPALRTLREAPVQLDALEAQLQVMRSEATEAAALRATPPVDPAQASAALKAATERLGAAGKLSLQGERAVLSVSGIGTAALGDWLAEARSGARARPIEATLTRSGNGYDGSVVVEIGSAS
ncbi:MAG: type II secretion system protein M [Burkholderiales bacterium]|nr:type II secretion system protein M [Burkholderiales bacterium]MDE2160070.1 type II secretion system protein M [Burkholderiales bacterium]MDE2502632.1 type II secretion system protein M [Burkholderiales bacterium]